MFKQILKYVLKAILVIITLAFVYVLTLCYPQVFFKYKQSLGNITIYSDEEIPAEKMSEIIKCVQSKIEKSVIYKIDTKHNIYIANNTLLWNYFTNINYKAGGLNYVIFNHSIFLRKVNIADNRLYGPSGAEVPGDRTLDYFIAHEITHTMEFQSMDWYKYPIQTNWVLEGYAEYVAHDSVAYENAQNYYLNIPETTGAKYYTRARTLVAYLLENKDVAINDLWSEVSSYETTKVEAIPDDRPMINDEYKF
jgi:hypothetical protein